MPPAHPAQPETAAAPPQERADQSRDLNAAIEAVFAGQMGGAGFAERFCELVQALTNVAHVSLWTRAPQDDAGGDEAGVNDTAPDGGDGEGGGTGAGADMRASKGTPKDAQALQNLAAGAIEALDTGAGQVVLHAGYFAADITAPDGQALRLFAALPPGGQAAAGLAYERISLLRQLASAHFENPQVRQLQNLRALAGEVAAYSEGSLQRLADTLAEAANADHAAAAYWRDGAVAQLAISGQSGFAKRAQLPARLRETLAQTARQNISLPHRAYVAGASRASGLVMLVEQPRRAPHVVPMTAAFYTLAEHARPPRRWTWTRLSKWAVGIALVAGIGLRCRRATGWRVWMCRISSWIYWG